MQKTLYSLMLNDEVVREVDALAHRLGTNRSSLINEILAEYVNYTTPERRINDILSAISDIMSPAGDLVPYFTPHTYSMSLKSSLEFKYRPTIKYEVELFKGAGETIGAISVVFRTQSEVLINGMTEFFRLWKSIEDAHLAPVLGTRAGYELYEGRFTRSICAPSIDCTADVLASALSEYIRIFDKLLKGWLSGTYDAHDVEAAYCSFLASRRIHF